MTGPGSFASIRLILCLMLHILTEGSGSGAPVLYVHR